ncbi:type II toxin-antitoxin system VapC family toxin [Neorhizobium sp. T25_13]|uniref:type II toxin-antitoxin system VapC family toxin n=1 Tax=Neorhizobium sp. T25_13 TaxID=2093830 RepID=UPI000CF8E231|nr:type II toxin-antitoxin system VapC family toxin [Neorhizobium sp. T25_13]
MIVLDTNVISEPAKPIPNQSVVAWLNAQPTKALYLTATSLAELFVGIEILSDGKRKAQVHQRMSDLVGLFFGPRILSFDRDSAAAYALIMAQATRKGRAISFADGQIAAIAQVHNFTVATRDTAPFEAAGIPVINPWKL